LEGTGRSRRITGATLALTAVLAWGCGLRVWLALPGLDKDRFWDEQFGVENLCSLLVDGQLRPANGLHPGLSYLPHAALLWASEGLHRLTGRPLFAAFAGDDLSPTGYLLCRLLQALAATLSLYLTYLIGRRLESPAVGVTGALLLAVVPWHLRQSAIFKPDILLVAASLAAFAASLEAAERPTWRRFAGAGAAVGLALATKFNAAPIALPVAVAALADGGWRGRRSVGSAAGLRRDLAGAYLEGGGQRWGALLLAGLAAVAVWLLFTPFLALDPGFYIWSFGRTWRDYAVKGTVLHGSHLLVLTQGLRALLSDSFHGPLIATLGFAGLLLAPAAARRLPPESSRARRLGPLMMLAYVAGYALFYAAASTNPSEHNWLPVTPFVALGAAWTVLRALTWITSRRSVESGAWQRQALGAAALAAAAVYLAAPANSYVYDTCVPLTQSLARDYLQERLRPLGWRVVVREEDGDAQGYSSPAIVQEVKDLAEVPAPELDRADAEIFHANRLVGARGAFYRRRIEARGVEVARFTPRPFRARGQALVVVVHPWADQGEPQQLELSPLRRSRERLAAELPAGGPTSGVASLEVWLPPGADPEILQDVLVGERQLSPVFERREAGSPRFVTERFQLPAPGARVTLVLARPFPPDSGVGMQLQRWRPPDP
jgi:hypothetical protein